ALAIGTAHTPDLPPEHLGRRAQAELVATGVRAAMVDAGIADPADVHFVQIKCPLLTAERIAEAEARAAATPPRDTLTSLGLSRRPPPADGLAEPAARAAATATRDTLKSMGLSRGASALGVGLALGEVAAS